MVTPRLGATRPPRSSLSAGRRGGRGLLHLKNEEREVQRASALGQCHTELAASVPKPPLSSSTRRGAEGYPSGTSS